MLRSLSPWSCFEPNTNPNYDLSQLGPRKEGYFHLSGDYTSATDGLNYYASQLVFKRLINELEDRGHSDLSKWTRWESKNHLVHYPDSTKLCSVIQENGQLMGSLLSFPVLSILNAFTVCYATGSDLESVPALFHGDDVAAYMNEEQMTKWKMITSTLGLELSIGKNYVSKDFVSIDSQLFQSVSRWNHSSEWVKSRTGKFRLIKDRDDGVLTCRPAMDAGFTKDIIRVYGQNQIKNTIRNLDVSSDFGGLGIEGVPKESRDIAIYQIELRRKTRVQMMCDGFYSVPKEFVRFNKLSSTQVPSTWDQLQVVDKPTSESKLRLAVKKWKDDITYDRNIFFPLPLITRSVVHCVNMDLASIQRVVDRLYGIKSNIRNDHYNPLSICGETWRGPKPFLSGDLRRTCLQPGKRVLRTDNEIIENPSIFDRFIPQLARPLPTLHRSIKAHVQVTRG